jgi:hypothetical protein
MLFMVISKTGEVKVVKRAAITLQSKTSSVIVPHDVVILWWSMTMVSSSSSIHFFAEILRQYCIGRECSASSIVGQGSTKE